MNKVNSILPCLHLILGPMYAEKSTSLLRYFRKLKVSGKKAVLVKFQGDTRYTDKNYISTHDYVFKNNEAVVCSELGDLTRDVIDEYDVFCIDEIQFFKDNLEFCQYLRSIGKIVVVSGLYADFQRVPFKRMPEMIAVADRVEFLTAICNDCSEDRATVSFRKTASLEKFLIGSSEIYMPLCQLCYEKRCV